MINILATAVAFTLLMVIANWVSRYLHSDLTSILLAINLWYSILNTAPVRG